MKTYMANKQTSEPKWYIVNAEGKTLGRLATQVANVLRGKNKPTFTPHVDCGDYVIVINAAKVKVTGNKLDDKMYYHHSGYPGGLRVTPLKELMATYPERVIEKAIKGMIPHTKLGDQVYKKLFVYKDENHKHQAQQPVELEIN